MESKQKIDYVTWHLLIVINYFCSLSFRSFSFHNFAQSKAVKMDVFWLIYVI